MKIQIFQKKKNLRIGIFFENWEKSFIENGAKLGPREHKNPWDPDQLASGSTLFSEMDINPAQTE